eukprot:Rmarinus@m.25958
MSDQMFRLPPSGSYSQNMLQKISELDDLCDLVFLVKDITEDSNAVAETIRAHRIVLAAASDVFRVLLFGHFKEAQSNGPIELNDVNPTAFRHVVRYMYTGSVSMDLKDLIQFCNVADRFGVHSIRERSAELIAAQLTALGCKFLLQFGDDLARLCLLEPVMEATCAMWDQVLELEGFAGIEEEILTTLIKYAKEQHASLNREVSRLHAVSQWAEAGGHGKAGMARVCQQTISIQALTAEELDMLSAMLEGSGETTPLPDAVKAEASARRSEYRSLADTLGDRWTPCRDYVVKSLLTLPISDDMPGDGHVETNGMDKVGDYFVVVLARNEEHLMFETWDINTLSPPAAMENSRIDMGHKDQDDFCVLLGLDDRFIAAFGATMQLWELRRGENPLWVLGKEIHMKGGIMCVVRCGEYVVGVLEGRRAYYEVFAMSATDLSVVVNVSLAPFIRTWQDFDSSVATDDAAYFVGIDPATEEESVVEVRAGEWKPRLIEPLTGKGHPVFAVRHYLLMERMPEDEGMLSHRTFRGPAAPIQGHGHRHADAYHGHDGSRGGLAAAAEAEHDIDRTAVSSPVVVRESTGGTASPGSDSSEVDMKVLSVWDTRTWLRLREFKMMAGVMLWTGDYMLVDITNEDDEMEGECRVEVWDVRAGRPMDPRLEIIFPHDVEYIVDIGGRLVAQDDYNISVLSAKPVTSQQRPHRRHLASNSNNSSSANGGPGGGSSGLGGSSGNGGSVEGSGSRSSGVSGEGSAFTTPPSSSNSMLHGFPPGELPHDVCLHGASRSNHLDCESMENHLGCESMGNSPSNGISTFDSDSMSSCEGSNVINDTSGTYYTDPSGDDGDRSKKNATIADDVMNTIDNTAAWVNIGDSRPIQCHNS